MYANANDYHQSGTREEKETHMCKGFIFSCIVILAALLINGFYYAWQDPITWFAIVLIGVEWLLFFLFIQKYINVRCGWTHFKGTKYAILWVLFVPYCFWVGLLVYF
eukprot:555625_1